MKAISYIRFVALITLMSVAAISVASAQSTLPTDYDLESISTRLHEAGKFNPPKNNADCFCTASDVALTAQTAVNKASAGGDATEGHK